jgi:hypothetical protein
MSEQGELPGFEKPKNRSKKTQEQSFEDTQKRIVQELGIKIQGERVYPKENQFSVTDPRTKEDVTGKVARDQNGNIIWCYDDGKIIWNLDTIFKIYSQLHPYQNEIPFVRLKMVEEIARWRSLHTIEEIKKIKERYNIPLSREEISYNRKKEREREALLMNVGVRKARRRKS